MRGCRHGCRRPVVWTWACHRTVSLAELSAGVHSAVDAVERARRVLRLQRVEATFSPLSFDVEAARQYGIIAAEVIMLER
jgi:predicted nucleic acid-binding protein